MRWMTCSPPPTSDFTSSAPTRSSSPPFRARSSTTWAHIFPSSRRSGGYRRRSRWPAEEEPCAQEESSPRRSRAGHTCLQRNGAPAGDGPSDDTADVVKSFDDVRYIWQENGGPGSARNTGVAAAQGDFIAVSDSDDLVAPGRLGLQARYLIDHPDVDAVLGRQEWLNAPDWLARDAVYGDLAGVPVG